MTELGLKQAGIQERGGPSPAKVREIVNGRASTLSPSKRRDFERALEWEPKSIDDVLAGGDPTPQEPLANYDAESDTDSVPDAVIDAENQVADEERILESNWGAVDDLVTAVLESQPSEDLRASTERIVFLMSGYMIIRILQSGFAPELEKWLERIYVEREQFYRRLAIGEPHFPWKASPDDDHAAMAAEAARRWTPRTDIAHQKSISDKGIDHLDFDTQESRTAIESLKALPTQQFANWLLLYGEYARTSDASEVEQALSDLVKDTAAILAIQNASLSEHYAEMRRRVELNDQKVLTEQANQLLGPDIDPDELIAPELPDHRYLLYLAARHSSFQGGDSEWHGATGLTADEAEAATTRYRREMAELRLFDGVRTAAPDGSAFDETEDDPLARLGRQARGFVGEVDRGDNSAEQGT